MPEEENINSISTGIDIAIDFIENYKPESRQLIYEITEGRCFISNLLYGVNIDAKTYKIRNAYIIYYKTSDPKGFVESRLELKHMGLQSEFINKLKFALEKIGYKEDMESQEVGKLLWEHT